VEEAARVDAMYAEKKAVEAELAAARKKLQVRDCVAPQPSGPVSSEVRPMAREEKPLLAPVVLRKESAVERSPPPFLPSEMVDDGALAGTPRMQIIVLTCTRMSVPSKKRWRSMHMPVMPVWQAV
jgi:hypothetical protein